MTQATDYRPNVVGVFINDQNEFLVGKRVDLQGVWQFPQGGIDANETPEQAIKREMWEEIGVKNFAILRKAKKTVRYDFPEKYLKNSIKGNYKGQEQTWFLLKLNEDEDPNLDIAPDQEFSEIKWSNLDKVVEGTIYWKKHAYLKGLSLLGIEVNPS